MLDTITPTQQCHTQLHKLQIASEVANKTLAKPAASSYPAKQRRTVEDLGIFSHVPHYYLEMDEFKAVSSKFGTWCKLCEMCPQISFVVHDVKIVQE